MTLAEAQKQHILKIYAETGYNVMQTAVILGIGRATLYRKLNEYGVSTKLSGLKPSPANESL